MQLAESRAFAGKVAPSPARLRYVMAAIETRHAELARARPLLERALAAEGSIEAYSMLASIERQQKRTEQALAALTKVVELSRLASDPIAECEALFQKFEILRDAGRQDAAAAALAAALVRSIETQRVARPGPSQARVERLLARVIEQYGDRPAVHRATERAFAAAGGDIRQLSATILDRARRSLVQSDLQSARAATQRALEAGLGPDEMVYVAVWQFLLENKLNARSDGLVEEALATLDEEAVWPLRLRAWTRGKLSDSELRAAAKSAAERTEANFYAAMAAHVRGRPEAQAGLRDVADSPAIDLMEVGIARELIAPPHKYALPANITLP
jgi:tetratricopeptide (TPR) repeat protein